MLVVDRYEIGERATSARARAPTPWLHAMGVQDAICQELKGRSFRSPPRTAPCATACPWTWSSFDYRAAVAGCSGSSAETRASRGPPSCTGRTGDTVHTDRGDVHARRSRGRRTAAGGGCSATRTACSPPRRRARAVASRCIRTTRARVRRATSTSGSTARSCAAATGGTCRRPARVPRGHVLLRPARSASATGTVETAARLRPAPGALPGQLLPAPAAPRGRGRRPLRRRQRRPLPSRCRARGSAPRCTSAMPRGRELRGGARRPALGGRRATAATQRSPRCTGRPSRRPTDCSG